MQIYTQKLSLFLVMLIPIMTITLYPPQNLQSANLILYQNSTKIMSNFNYQITFNIQFPQIPTLCYGINHYQMNDKFYYEYIITKITDIKTASFQIQVILGMSTSVTKFSINYLAIGRQSNFVAGWKSYVNSANISTGSGDRSLLMHELYNFSSSITKGVAMITGFHIESITHYKINISFKVITQNYYEFTISTSHDCVIKRADISMLFYYPNRIADDYYVVANSSLYVFNQIDTEHESYLLADGEQTIIFLGIRMFEGVTSKSLIDFGWNIDKDVNGTYVITFNTKYLSSLGYSFVQIASYHNQTIINQTQTTAQSVSIQNSGNVLLIIVAVTVPLVLIMIVVSAICSFRIYRKRKMERKLSKQSLTELPSLAF